MCGEHGHNRLVARVRALGEVHIDRQGLQVVDDSLDDHAVEVFSEAVSSIVLGVDPDHEHGCRATEFDHPVKCFGAEMPVGEGSRTDYGAVPGIERIDGLGEIGFEELPVDVVPAGSLLGCSTIEHRSGNIDTVDHPRGSLTSEPASDVAGATAHIENRVVGGCQKVAPCRDANEDVGDAQWVFVTLCLHELGVVGVRPSRVQIPIVVWRLQRVRVGEADVIGICHRATIIPGLAHVGLIDAPAVRPASTTMH